MGIRGELFSTQFNSSTERRSYFFNVKENRRGDIYLTLVESKKSESGAGYERHQLVLFEDDFERFVRELNKAIDYVKTETGSAASAHDRPGRGDSASAYDRYDRPSNADSSDTGEAADSPKPSFFKRRDRFSD